jgi:hypothetical protein
MLADGATYRDRCDERLREDENRYPEYDGNE